MVGHSPDSTAATIESSSEEGSEGQTVDGVLPIEVVLCPLASALAGA